MVKIKVIEEKSKKDKKKLFIPIFIASVMILSVFGVIVGNLGTSEDTNSNNLIEYKGFKFIKTDLGWQTNVNNFQISILNSPNEINDIILNMPKESLKEISKVYISRNPKEYINNLDLFLQSNLRQLVNTQIACNVDIEECKNLPLKSCNDIDNNTFIIMIKISDKNEFNFNNNCLNIRGNTVYLSKVIDKLILNIFGL